MLVMTVQEGDILRFGSEIQVFVKRNQGGKLSLAIAAPRQLDIKRLPAAAEEPVMPEVVHTVLPPRIQRRLESNSAGTVRVREPRRSRG